MGLLELSERSLDEFRHQMARALASGVEAHDLIQRLVEQGLEEEVASRLILHLQEANEFILESLQKAVTPEKILHSLTEAGFNGELAEQMLGRLATQHREEEEKNARRRTGRGVVWGVLGLFFLLLQLFWLKASLWKWLTGGLLSLAALELFLGARQYFRLPSLNFHEKEYLYDPEALASAASECFRDGMPSSFPGIPGLELGQTDPIRIYRWDEYDAYLYNEMEPYNTLSGPRFRHIMAVYQEEAPILAVTSEENILQQLGGFHQWFKMDSSSSGSVGDQLDQHTHFLCMFTQGQRQNYGSSDRWADLLEFESRSLDLMQEHLSLTDDPTLVLDREGRLN